MESLALNEEQHRARWLIKGAKVEVALKEEGLLESRYGATVLARNSKGHVHVEFEAFFEDTGANVRLREWVDYEQVLPPPPRTPVGFYKALDIGASLQFLFDAGWWDVILIQRRTPTAAEPGGFLVRSALYQTEYWTDEGMLRPKWMYNETTGWEMHGAHIEGPPARKLPTGWVELVHRSPSRDYSTYAGPCGKKARSCAEAWRVHEAERAGQHAIVTRPTTRHFDLGEYGVVAAQTSDEAGIVGIIFDLPRSTWSGYENGTSTCCARGFVGAFPWPQSKGPAYIVQALDDMHCYPVMPHMLPSELQAQYSHKSRRRSRKRIRKHAGIRAPNKSPNGALIKYTAPAGNSSAEGTPEAHTPTAGKCVHCLDAPAETVFVHGDSGHRCCCAGCAKVWMHARRRDCPICRRRIEHVVRLFDAAVYD